jgi:hypothetical protein
MKLIGETLFVKDKPYHATCNVRTLRDGTRRKDEVVRSIPTGSPYDPRPFPSGLWQVTGVEWLKDYDPLYGTVKIKTNAQQLVNVWELDENGCYLRETGNVVWDWAYWLHYSESSTTLGCIRFDSVADAETVARIVEDYLRRGMIVELDS